MARRTRVYGMLALAAALVTACAGRRAVGQALNQAPEGFTALFNGDNLEGWVADEEAKQHWLVQDGVIRYDGGNADLWTEKEYGDFILMVDWRFPREPQPADLPQLTAAGDQAVDADGQPINLRVWNAGDSGIYLRGNSKSQINIWCWPSGSGEIYGYRTDGAMPPEVRAGCTPSVNADSPPGEWNRFTITMQGDRLTVNVNGFTVIREVQLPGVPATGRIALQHHGDPIEFRNIYIKEL